MKELPHWFNSKRNRQRKMAVDASALNTGVGVFVNKYRFWAASCLQIQCNFLEKIVYSLTHL
jgi:hypothetical protein